ncbi:recombinase XerD [Paucilactobacillus sp. N302-9]
MIKIAYPYQAPFNLFLQNQQKSAATIASINQTLTQFFDFMATTSSFQTNPSVNNIFDRDIESFITQHQNVSPATYNKWLSQLNNYFKYLFTHQLNTHLPTINLHGQPKAAQSTISYTWLEKLDDILNDPQLHWYTKLTLLLLANGYQVAEILQPQFYLAWQDLTLTNTQQSFRQQFNDFISPLQHKQHSADIFLKQRIDIQHPQLSLPGLHKYLKPDSHYLGFSLAPKYLHQSYVLHFLQFHPTLNDQELEKQLGLDPQSLLYYRKLLIQNK